MLCIENAGTHRSWANSAVSGRRMRLCRSAAGKLTVAMLSGRYPPPIVFAQVDQRTPRTLTPARLSGELERIRHAGCAAEVEETRIGHHAAAIPVLWPGNVRVGALSVIAPTAGTSLARVLRELTTAAGLVTSRLARLSAYAAPS